jgi:hypothetical protein
MMAAILKLPNFFIVGAPKAGTTSLYAYLDQHPQIYMSPLKEPNYFAFELREENFSAADRPRLARESAELQRYLNGDLREKRFGGLVSDWADYAKLFRHVSGETAIGEASACYLWSQTAAHNIAQRIPHARIIISLRNPADRAFSQFLQMTALGVVRGSFRRQIEDSMRCVRKEFGPSWPLLEFGQYHGQVQRYLNEFPRAQIHISLYEELEKAPDALLSALFRFLGVRADFAGDVSQRHHEPVVPRLAGAAYYLKKWGIWPHLRKLIPRTLGPRAKSLTRRARASLRMELADRALLADYYRDDIRKLESLLGRDLSAWLSADR